MVNYYVMKTPTALPKDRSHKFADFALKPARSAFGRKVVVTNVNSPAATPAPKARLILKIVKIVLFFICSPATFPMTLLGFLTQGRSKSYKALKTNVKTNSVAIEGAPRTRFLLPTNNLSSKNVSKLHNNHSWSKTLSKASFEKIKESFEVKSSTVVKGASFLTIDASPHDKLKRDVGFKGLPVYLNIDPAKFLLTPLYSILKVIDMKGDEHFILASKAVNLEVSDFKNPNWVWVAVDEPQKESQVVEMQLLDKWWTGKIQSGENLGNLAYIPGFVKSLFKDYQGQDLTKDAIEIKIELESGNIYFETENNSPLFLAKPDSFIGNEKEEILILKGSFGTYQVKAEKGHVGEKEVFVAKEQPQPFSLNSKAV